MSKRTDVAIILLRTECFTIDEIVKTTGYSKSRVLFIKRKLKRDRLRLLKLRLLAAAAAEGRAAA